MDNRKVQALVLLFTLIVHLAYCMDPWLGKHLAQIKNAQILASSRWHQNHLSSFGKSQVITSTPRIFFPTDNGADPTGGSDSTTALQLTIDEAFEVASTHTLMPDIVDLGGVEIHLGGGQYVISKPLTFPDSGGGNVVFHGGTIRASGTFPSDGYLVEVATTELREEWEERKAKMSNGGEAWETRIAFENVHFKDLLLDANFSGGGVLLLNALRTTISNCYVTHFANSSVGINVQGGHETLIQQSFLGQQITSGGHPQESAFGGTAIVLAGNDNAVTDVVIFSAAIGIDIGGQANIVTGIHCYNKATGWGGVGIIVRQGADQTRILACYMDFTGITLEESKQIVITNNYFLGDAYVLLKGPMSSSPPSVLGLVITHNIFSGSGQGVPIVQILGNFSHVKQTCVDDNSVTGMATRSTRVRASVSRFGTNWTFDLSQTLLFPNSFAHVQYSFFSSPTTNHGNMSSIKSWLYPRHALQQVSHNNIVIASEVPMQATVSIFVDQSYYNDDDQDISKLYTSLDSLM